MRALLQRVSAARVAIDGEVGGEIDHGFLVLLGIEEADADEDVEWLSGKVANMRVFDDDAGQMNLALGDVGGRCLVVSQFTLHANTKKGNRPSFIRAARPEQAVPLYEAFVAALERKTGKTVATGEFGANMQVSLTNDGPVTIWIDSKNRE
jgi:D-tyrosyl-tRNA(Tyr) deacylase